MAISKQISTSKININRNKTNKKSSNFTPKGNSNSFDINKFY